MATYEITEGGKTYEIGGVESPEQAYSMLRQSLGDAPAPAPAAPTVTPREPSAVQQTGQMLNTLPRQFGLTARYALEGPAKMAEIVTEPVRRALIGLGDASRSAQKSSGGMLAPTDAAPAPAMPKPLSAAVGDLATRAGLPNPETPTERVVAEGTKMGFGALAGAGAAKTVADAITTPVQAAIGRIAPSTLTRGQNAAQALAANPAQQVGGAAGAGAAGQTSKEGGGTPLQQGISAAAGGVLGSFAPAAVSKVADSVRAAFAPKASQAEIDIALSNLFRPQNIDYASLPNAAKASLREEMQRAMATGGSLDPHAAERLAAFATVGARPTRGMLSQNPVDVTNEQNLAKIAANTTRGELSGLPAQLNANNSALIGRLNDLGANTNRQAIDAGRTVTDAITGQRDTLRTAEQAAWNAAKGMPGYKTGQLSTEPVHAAFKAVDDLGLLDKLDPAVNARFQAFMTGKVPFTPQEYKNLRELISGSLSPTSDGNVKAAARAAANAFDEASIRMATTNPGGIDYRNLPSTAATAARMRAADAAPQEAIDAIDAARRATRTAYAYEDSNNLVRSVLADARSADPEKIAQSFVLNGTLNDAREVAQAVGPQGVTVIRDALANDIKRQALSGASDEVGKVSQSALNRAINKIGQEKLSLFFSPEEIAMLRATGRVASLQQSQPIGSAVNNSNSGALLIGRGMDALKGIAEKLPGGQQFVIDPAQNLSVAFRTRQAQNVAPALIGRMPGSSPDAAPYLPALAITSGALLAQ